VVAAVEAPVAKAAPAPKPAKAPAKKPAKKSRGDDLMNVY